MAGHLNFGHNGDVAPLGVGHYVADFGLGVEAAVGSGVLLEIGGCFELLLSAQ